MLTTHNLLDSREGRAIRALKGGMVMAEAMGVDTSRSRMVIFVIAALHACASGWLYAHMQRFVNPTPFGVHIGIEYLFMAVVGGAGHVWGALVGAGLITDAQAVAAGHPAQLLGSNRQLRDHRVRRLMVIGVAARPRRPVADSGPAGAGACPCSKTIDASDAESLPRRTLPKAGELILEARNVTRKFGGLVANNNMSLSVRAGEILALIGPNGAGKSTMFNQLSGVDTPTSGEVLFLGQPVAGRIRARSPHGHEPYLPARQAAARHERARERGHRRPSARRQGRAVARPGAWTAPKRHASSRKPPGRSSASGLAEFMYEEAGSLALGQQRILEIARALCADPCLLLLDEPAAGLRSQGEGGARRVAAQTARRRHGDADRGARHGLRDEPGG
jgi:energy-coupling factor transporter ATP-binding protein EcfA2